MVFVLVLLGFAR